MEWTKEQQEAIYKNNSNILVAAGAGSGKTAVLVERIINKVVNEKVDIDKLLIVTFTNAAASEMRERILNAIYKKIDEIQDEKQVENLQKQVILLNKASICTIDSFCLDVIRNNFFEIDVSPNFRIGDTPEMDLLKQEVLEELFEEKYEAQDKDFQELIKTYTSYKDDTPLKELVLNINKYISSSPYPRKWIEEKIEKFNIKDFAMKFSETEWGKLLLEEIEEEIIDDIKVLKQEYIKISVDNTLKDFANLLQEDCTQLQYLLDNLDDWDKARKIADLIKFNRWSSKKVEWLDNERVKNIRDKTKKSFYSKRDKIFVSSSKEVLQDIKDMYGKLTKLQKLVFEFEDRFMQKKKERNILDFGDIEHLALKILVKTNENGKHTRTEVAKKYQQKFVEIAIDEYQDSNLVQEYILTSISRGNNIFMVGDVKQSIYKFRQAMPELFLDKYESYTLENANDKGLKIKLFKNFRSRENILNFINAVFEKIMSKDLGDIDYTEDEYLNLGAGYGISNEDLLTEIDIIDLAQDKEEVEEETEEKDEENEEEQEERIDNIELEARFLASKIKKLVDDKFQVYDLKKNTFRDIKYKDIIILLRSTKTKAPIFEKELINADIPVYSDMSSDYISSMEIQTIISLLKIIDNPMQDIPLVTVLRSSIGGFTDNDLVEIRLADKYSDFYVAMLKAKISVSESLRQKIEDFLGKLDKWREEQEYLSLNELIWTIYEDTNYINYVGILPNGTLRQANLKMLFERAKQYETVSFKGLFNFIKYIEKIDIGSGDLSSAKIIGENEDVVRIMSIHKSKGLEFPVIFLSSTNTNFNMMDLNNDILLDQNLGIGVKYIDYDMQIKYDTLTKMALRNKLKIDNLSEEMRVLYVALTRAKEKIFITGVDKNFEKSKQEKEQYIEMYKNVGRKLNQIIVKKYKSYLDWLELIYFSDLNKMKDMTNFNVYKKSELLRNLKNDYSKEIDVLKLIDENAKDVTKKDLDYIQKELFFEYQFIEESKIPSKTSVTAIAHRDMQKIKNSILNEDDYLKPIEIEDFDVEEKRVNKQNEDEEIMYDNENQQAIEFPVPNFMKGNEEEKVSSARKGTIVHLCMKNLDFSKEYSLDDIKSLIDDLKKKSIITEQEAESINLHQIYKFTKSEVWKKLKNAKEVYKEEPFYINVPASEVLDVNSKEPILTQGIIDLYYIDEDDNLVVLDYKTDFVNKGDEQVLIERHKNQLMIYKYALENALDRKVDIVYIYSTELGKEIEV